MSKIGRMVIDKYSFIKYCNPAFAKVFGYTPGELIGQHMSILIADGQRHPHGTADNPADMSQHVGKHEAVRQIGTVLGKCRNGKDVYITTYDFEHPTDGGDPFIMAGSSRLATQEEIDSFHNKSK